MFLESDCPSLFVEMLRNFIALDRWDPEPAVGDSWLGTVREPQCHSGQTLPAENTGVHRGPPALTARGTRGLRGNSLNDAGQTIQTGYHCFFVIPYVSCKKYKEDFNFESLLPCHKK